MSSLPPLLLFVVAFTFRTAESPINLGYRIRSISFVSEGVVVFRMPSVTLLAKSNTPTTGLVTAPTSPFPTPAKKPPTPSLDAPSIG
jgi:hypothetical protein